MELKKRKTKELLSPIKSIGISINGGWDKKPKHFQTDKSVNINSVKVAGEVSNIFTDIEIAKDWAWDYYPQWLNSSCGLRIQLEVANKELFDQLMTAKFYELFRKTVRVWAKENRITRGSNFWKRLDGDNKYCEKGFSTKEKFRQLNFTHKDINVIECRVFPTFQKRSLSCSAIEYFYDLCNNYLALRSLVS